MRNSRVISLVISSEFIKKQKFKLKKIEKLIYIRNIHSIFNKERSIEHTVKINISYKEYSFIISFFFFIYLLIFKFKVRS